MWELNDSEKRIFLSIGASLAKAFEECSSAKNNPKLFKARRKIFNSFLPQVKSLKFNVSYKMLLFLDGQTDEWKQSDDGKYYLHCYNCWGLMPIFPIANVDTLIQRGVIRGYFTDHNLKLPLKFYKGLKPPESLPAYEPKEIQIAKRPLLEGIQAILDIDPELAVDGNCGNFAVILSYLSHINSFVGYRQLFCQHDLALNPSNGLEFPLYGWDHVMLKSNNWYYDHKGKRERVVILKEEARDTKLPYVSILDPISEKEALIGIRLGSRKKVDSILEKLLTGVP